MSSQIIGGGTCPGTGGGGGGGGGAPMVPTPSYMLGALALGVCLWYLGAVFYRVRGNLAFEVSSDIDI